MEIQEYRKRLSKSDIAQFFIIYITRIMIQVLNSFICILQGTKHQTVVKLTVVPCPPVVEVLIKRPDVKYQLGFSVQNGVVSISL